jgi:hypothetical protein
MASGLATILVVFTAAAVGMRQGNRLATAKTPADCIALLGSTGRWLAIYGLLMAGAVAWR